MASLFYWICMPFAWLVRLFYTTTKSYGIALILFTLVVKLVLLPFQMKSKKSMVRMNRMSGKMQEIQKKYANNQMKMNEEMQKLYTEQGINPASGCLWSFLPMPILIALYYIIREPIVYFMNFGSRANGMAVLEQAKEVVRGLGLSWTIIERTGNDGAFSQIEILKHIVSNVDKPAVQDFLSANPSWVNVDYHFLNLDLAELPSNAIKMFSSNPAAAIGLISIPLIATAFQFVMMLTTMKDQPKDNPAAASSKMMMYTMPLMTLWIGFTLPAALGVYWAAQAAFSAVQEFLMGKFYNGKLEEEENERQRLIEEDRKKRQEQGRKQQELQRKQVEKKPTLKEKRAAAQAAKETKKNKVTTTEAGRVNERPYARGRSYQADRYNDK